MTAQGKAPSTGKRLLLRALNVFAGDSSVPARMKGDVRRILVVELWNIGDVVLLLPFLAQLRVIFPKAQVTLLARPHARMILEGTGLVDEFVSGDDPKENWLSFDPLEGGWGDLARLRRQLRRREFDLAFQCRLHLREYLILSMSGATRRIGPVFRSPVFRDGERFADGMIPPGDQHRHKVEQWVRLLDAVGGPVATGSPSLVVSEAEQWEAWRLLSAEGVTAGDMLVGVHPGASLPEKRWPLERFTEVAKDLAGRHGTRVITFVDPAGYGAAAGRIDGVITARPGLRELIALIDRCAVLVCNDSGPMHIAGALDVPTVAMFGAGIDEWFSPLGGGHELLSGDVPGAAGIQGISASRVLEAVDGILTAREARDR